MTPGQPPAQLTTYKDWERRIARLAQDDGRNNTIPESTHKTNLQNAFEELNVLVSKLDAMRHRFSVCLDEVRRAYHEQTSVSAAIRAEMSTETIAALAPRLGGDG